MYTKCERCHRNYDDAKQWTICPHSPLGFPIDDLCPRCDTLKTIHGPCRHQLEVKMHPAIQHVLKFFAYDHLPEKLQAVSKPFSELANTVANRAPDNQETTIALRKLLEAKDAAVRAALS